MVPVLSAIGAHYADNPHADVLVPMAMSVYALAIALFSPIAGLIVDRVGRRSLLILGLVAFASFGMAPLWVTSLEQLVLSRALLGVAAAVVFTGSWTMLGDASQGPRYARVMGMAGLVDNLTATGLYPLIGLLGESNWRYTSWPYASALGMALILTVVLVRQGPALPVRTDDRIHSHRRGLFRWGRLIPAAAFTLFASIIFYSPTVGSVLVLERVEVTSPETLGIVSGVMIGMTAIGSGIFIEVVRARLTMTVTVALAFAATGFLIVAGSGTPHNKTVAGVLAIVGLVVAGLGCGLLLPAMNTWCTHFFTNENRGRGFGIIVGSFYLGVFLVPIAARLLVPRVGGILAFFGGLSTLAFVVGLGTGVMALRSTREHWWLDDQGLGDGGGFPPFDARRPGTR